MFETIRNFAGQLAGGVEQREVLLVLPHGEDQALLRHLQERLVELADVDARVLDQRRDLVKQDLILAEIGILLFRLGLQLPVYF